MGMSAKAKALLTGEKGSEWQKYQMSMQKAYNDFAEEQAKAQTKQTKRSGWAKMLGTAAFITAIALTGGLSAIATGGMAAVKTLAAGAAFGTLGAMTPQWTNPEIKLGKSKEDFMGDIYDPKFGAGLAELEKSKLGSDIDIDVTALKAYEEGGLETALFENVGRTSSYIGQVGSKG